MGKRTRKELQHYWQHHIEQWERSDQSGPHYCEQHELTYGQFNYWKSKLTANRDATQSITASTNFVRVIQQQESNRSKQPVLAAMFQI